MATTLTPHTLNGPYPADGVSLVFGAVDVAGNRFRSSGKDLLLVRNPTGGALNFTLTSVASPPQNRLGHITNDSIAAGALHQYYLTGPGWADGNGMINCTPTAGLTIAVIRLA